MNILFTTFCFSFLPCAHHDNFPRLQCRHDTLENSLIIIFLWGVLRETFLHTSTMKTKVILCRAISRWFYMIHMNIICAMSFPCNLLFTTCSAAHSSSSPSRKFWKWVSQTMKLILYDGIRFIVQFNRCFRF